MCSGARGGSRGRGGVVVVLFAITNIPSKGFISASLAIVAHAPLVAAARGWCTPAWFPPMTCLTAS